MSEIEHEARSHPDLFIEVSPSGVAVGHNKYWLAESLGLVTIRLCEVEVSLEKLAADKVDKEFRGRLILNSLFRSQPFWKRHCLLAES